MIPESVKVTEIGSDKTRWTLDKECELRFEVSADKVFNITLVELTAELFGIELAPNIEYSFSDKKAAVFTWYGCIIETSGTADVCYVAKETPMVSYVNTHMQLEARRDQALSKLQSGEKAFGPKVLIAGSTDSGKSSLCKILTSYAVRLGRNPTLVDLDVGQGEITVPGCIAAAPLDSSTMSIEDGFGLVAPLVFFFGQSSPGANLDLYRHLVLKLAELVDRRMQNDKDAASSGIVVNTCGWVDGPGLELLKHCIKAFDIDVVLVMGNDRLYTELVEISDLQSSKAPSKVVVKLPLSGGLVQRSQQHRRQCRSKRIREYFYGNLHPERRSGGLSLSPCTIDLRFDDIRVCRVGGAQLSGGLLPVGQSALLGPTRVTQVKPSMDLLHQLLAVCHPLLQTDGTVHQLDEEEIEELGEAIANSNVAGFVHVSDVDPANRKMTVLSPCPGELPSCYLLVGNIKWTES